MLFITTANRRGEKNIRFLGYEKENRRIHAPDTSNRCNKFAFALYGPEHAPQATTSHRQPPHRAMQIKTLAVQLPRRFNEMRFAIIAT